MRDEFLITRSGKQYVLFAGLLDEAHQNGLRGIDTELVQIPTNENSNVAVVKATVEMEDGRTFSGIGDASPENVGRNIVPHIIRMAETRAKARALRDAVNVGVTALEELSDSGDAPPPQRSETGGRRGSEKPSLVTVGGQAVVEDFATQHQIDAINKLAEDLGDGDPHKVLDWLEDKVGYPPEMMTEQQAGQAIERLNKRKAEKVRG